MRPLKALISIKEAFDLIWDEVKPIERTVVLALQQAGGMVLADELVADSDVPPFSRAAMDGYAVRASDTFGATATNAKRVKVVGVRHAGDAGSEVVDAGQCLQIGTGAPLPAGADAVVMVEDTEREGDWAKIYRPVYPGANVMNQGADIADGGKILPAGVALTPSRVGVLAALGKDNVKVYDRPRVAVMPSGNEIRPPGQRLAPGQIYDVNSFTLAALIRENGGEATILPVLADEPSEIKSGLLNAVAEFDLIILSGGSSAGERDVMIDAIAACGQIKFHGIAVKPGKPTLGAIIAGKPVLVMPGYPTSCLTNAYFLLTPLLRKLARLPQIHQQKRKGVLSRRVTSTVGRYQFLTVRLNGEQIEPAFKESGAITSMALADGYVEIPENVDFLEKGEELEVTLFES
jgi:molybdenum cofactor synthesis domain-containing protein